MGSNHGGNALSPPSPPSPPSAVVFDLGGVLIDWNPRHLYRRLFTDEAAMERFLTTVCTPEWNARQDAGRPFAEAIDELSRAHPEQAELIAAYRERFGEMLAGEIEESVAIMRELKAAGVPVYALSNWSAETFPLARARFPFLGELDGLAISGELGVAKPASEIFRRFLERHGLRAGETVFVDDSEANVATAETLGFRAIRFDGAAPLRRRLERLGLPIGDRNRPPGRVAAGRSGRGPASGE